jgi:hypothetical protein
MTTFQRLAIRTGQENVASSGFDQSGKNPKPALPGISWGNASV